jgi:hypothetical protein
VHFVSNKAIDVKSINIISREIFNISSQLISTMHDHIGYLRILTINFHNPMAAFF